MRSKLILAWVILAFSASGVFSQNKNLTLDKGVAPNAAIDNIYEKFSQGYRDLDAKAVAGLYTADALYLPPNSDIKRGHTAILKDFTGFFDSTRSEGKKLAISFQILERKVSGDLAYDAGIFTLSITEKDGKSQVGRGKFVVIAVKVKGGTWRFQLDTYNDFPAK